jgi:diguanylate cyclase (GGDEF)-like protein
MLRARVEALGIPHPTAPTRIVTISAGVATAASGADSSPETLVAAADEALYRAKRAGRNRVEADGSG